MKRHMKRLAAPNTWPIPRKGKKRWVARPLPSGHKQRLCMPILVALRDVLKLASTKREVKRILHNNEILVNNRRVKKPRAAIGLFDVLAINKLKEYYRVVLTRKNKLTLAPIKKKEANVLPLKVRSKTSLRGGDTQINFTNGWNIRSKKKFSTKSTVLFDLKEGKVGEQLEIKKGNVVVVTAGKYVGRLAKVRDISEQGKLKKRRLVKVKTLRGDEVSTLEKNLLAVGKKKPEFTAVVEK